MPTILRRGTVYSTRWFELVEKHVDGEELPYYSLKPGLYVTILAITEDGRIPLVSQFRPR